MIKPGMIVTISAASVLALIAFLINYENRAIAVVWAVLAFTFTVFVLTLFFKNKVTEPKKQDVQNYAKIIALKLKNDWNLSVPFDVDSNDKITKWPETRALSFVGENEIYWSYVDATGTNKNVRFDTYNGIILGVWDGLYSVEPVERIKRAIDMSARISGIAEKKKTKSINAEEQPSSSPSTEDILRKIMTTKEEKQDARTD